MTSPSHFPQSSSSPSEASSLHTSLLLRLQAHDDEAWRRLDRLYGTVVFGWCRGAGLNAEDAKDVQQEVFGAVTASISRFRREQPSDSFRGWLWRITQNKLRDFFRRLKKQPHAPGGSNFQQQLKEIPWDISDTPVPAASDEETGGLFRRALELMQSEFEQRTWQAFWRVVIDEQAPADVAAELGMSAGAVYVAKSRVLRRFREEFGELLEGD